MQVKNMIEDTTEPQTHTLDPETFRETLFLHRQEDLVQMQVSEMLKMITEDTPVKFMFSKHTSDCTPEGFTPRFRYTLAYQTVQTHGFILHRVGYAKWSNLQRQQTVKEIILPNGDVKSITLNTEVPFSSEEGKEIASENLKSQLPGRYFYILERRVLADVSLLSDQEMFLTSMLFLGEKYVYSTVGPFSIFGLKGIPIFASPDEDEWYSEEGYPTYSLSGLMRECLNIQNDQY